MEIDQNEAIKRLLNKEVIGLSTDTILGLSCIYTADNTIEKIYRLKKRSKNKPLLLLVHTLSQISHIPLIIPKEATKFLEHFWPGPLTCIFSLEEAPLELSPLLIGPGHTISIRIPNQPNLQEIINKTGPVVAPSANLSGHKPAESKKEFSSYFGKDFPLHLFKNLQQGEASTIIKFTKNEIMLIREGEISSQQIREFLVHSSLKLNRAFNCS